MQRTSFFQDVYEVVKLIPYGRFSTYGAIAKYLGTGGSSRMVGWAMNGAHGMPDVPAHRVVNRLGQLSGRLHFKTPTLMAELLITEGIAVKDDQIVDFEKHFWDPAKEL